MDYYGLEQSLMHPTIVWFYAIVTVRFLISIRSYLLVLLNLIMARQTFVYNTAVCLHSYCDREIFEMKIMVIRLYPNIQIKSKIITINFN